MRKAITMVSVFVIFNLLILSQSYAQFPGRGEMGEMGAMGGKRQPPQEMIDACKDKSEGDPCTAKTPMGEKTGKCTSHDDQLICFPSDMPKMMGNNKQK